MPLQYGTVAFFISPHGFGHAARACAVMEALQGFELSISFEIFTLVPEWFFRESLTFPFSYHPVLTDIGLVQTTPLIEDVPATITRLSQFLPFDEGFVDSLAALVSKIDCRCIVCDISPLGIVVAQKANIPSMLIENFTWDWIYEGYAKHSPRLRYFVGLMAGAFDAVDHHVMTQPFHDLRPADMIVEPVSRKPRMGRSATRKALGIPENRPMVVVSMGGVGTKYDFIRPLESRPDICFVIPGSTDTLRRMDNIILLPGRSNFYHPDLVNASDATISKLGYSTLAEVYNAGVPFGYIQRSQFRESTVLAEFVASSMNGMNITGEEFYSCEWLNRLDSLIGLGRRPPEPHGAPEKIAAYLGAVMKE